MGNEKYKAVWSGDQTGSLSSPEILRGSDQVVDLMEKCLSNNELGFYGLTKIMEKDYYTYTHSINVGLYCMSFALNLGMPADF